MEEQGIEKALQDLAKALKDNDTVARVKVTITLVKPNRARQNPRANKAHRQGRGESPSRKSYYIIDTTKLQ